MCLQGLINISLNSLHVIDISWPYFFLSTVWPEGWNRNSHGRENNSCLCIVLLGLQDTSENCNLLPHRHRVGFGKHGTLKWLSPKELEPVGESKSHVDSPVFSWQITHQMRPYWCFTSDRYKMSKEMQNMMVKIKKNWNEYRAKAPRTCSSVTILF